MPHIVTLDLTPEGGTEPDDDSIVGAGAVPGFVRDPNKLVAADFRLHGGGVEHWLMRHPLGIDMLVNKLQEVRPDMKVPRYRITPGIRVLLDGMIDLLGMRAWPEPKTARERVRASWLIVRCAFCQGAGRPLPDWRAVAAVPS